MIRALIADDERLDRSALRSRLDREPDVQIVGEASDGNQAVEAIRSLRPDLLFLDVQIPGLNGFEVLGKVADEHLPLVVFVTAYDAQVLRSLEDHALDYLLKPYSASRIDESLRRVRAELQEGNHSAERARLGSLIETLGTEWGDPRPSSYPSRLAVHGKGDRILLVKALDIDAVEAAGNYVMLVEGTRRHLLRLTLSEVERQLDPARFARIHRSTIVNTDRVREIRLDPHGDCEIELEIGLTYRVSRAHRERFLARYGGLLP